MPSRMSINCLYSPDSTMTNRKEAMCSVTVICMEKLCNSPILFRLLSPQAPNNVWIIIFQAAAQAGWCLYSATLWEKFSSFAKCFSSEKLKQMSVQKEFMPELSRMNRRGKSARGKQNERLGWTGNRLEGGPLRADWEPNLEMNWEYKWVRLKDWERKDWRRKSIGTKKAGAK